MIRVTLAVAVFALALTGSAHAFILTLGGGNYVTPTQTIASVGPSSGSFSAGTSAGTAFATMATVMSPASPAFSGTYALSTTQGGCNGTNGANNNLVQISGSSLEVSSAGSSASAGTYAACVIAQQGGISNSPQGVAMTITISNSGTIAMVQKFTPIQCAGPTTTCSGTVTVNHPGDLLTLGITGCFSQFGCNEGSPSAKIVSVTDSQGNICASVPGTAVGASNGNASPAAEVGFCQNLSASGSDDITVNWSSTDNQAQSIWISPVEWSGVSAQNPVDSVAGFAQDESSSALTSIGPYGKASASGDLVYSVINTCNVTAAVPSQTALNTATPTQGGCGGGSIVGDQYQIAGASGTPQNTWAISGASPTYSGGVSATVTFLPTNAAQIQSVSLLGHQTFIPDSPIGTRIGLIESQLIPAGQLATYALTNSGTANNTGGSCSGADVSDFQIANENNLELNNASLNSGSYFTCIKATNGTATYTEAVTITGQSYAFPANIWIVSNQSGAAANGSYSVWPMQRGRVFQDGLYPGANGVNEATQCPAVTGYASVGAGTIQTTTSGSTTATLTGNAPATGTFYVSDNGQKNALNGTVPTVTMTTSSSTITFSAAESLPQGDVLTFFSESGTSVASGTNVKNAYPDGDIEFAVMDMDVPTSLLQTSAAPSLLWVTAASGACNNTPQTTTQMLSGTFNFDFQFNMTSPVTHQVSGRTMLTAANGQGGCSTNFYTIADYCRLWTGDTVATEALFTDDSQTTGTWDFGNGDGHTPIRPRVYATFWPTTGQVKLRWEMGANLTNYLEDVPLKYDLCSGYPTCNQVFPIGGGSFDLSGTSGPELMSNSIVDQEVNDAGTEMWLNGTPTNEVNVIDGLVYLESTHWIERYDPTQVYDESSMGYEYNAYGPGGGSGANYGWFKPFDGGYFPQSMLVYGANPWLALNPNIDVTLLYTGDWRYYYMDTLQDDLSLAMPGDAIENRAGYRLRRSDTPGSNTGLGFQESLTDNSTCGDTNICAGAAGTINGVCGSPPTYPCQPFVFENQHIYDPWYIPYILSGEPAYLNGLRYWSAWINGWQVPTSAQLLPGRLPNGSYSDDNGYGVFPRTFAWGLDLQSAAELATPDADPMKALEEDWMNDLISAWDGMDRLSAADYQNPSSGGSYAAYMASAGIGDGNTCAPGSTIPNPSGNCLADPLGAVQTNFQDANCSASPATAWLCYPAESSINLVQSDDQGTWSAYYYEGAASQAFDFGAQTMFPELQLHDQMVIGPPTQLSTAATEAIISPFHTAQRIPGGLNGTDLPFASWSQLSADAFDWKYANNSSGTFTGYQSGTTLTVLTIPSNQPLNLLNWISCGTCTNETLEGQSGIPANTWGGLAGTYTMSISQNVGSAGAPVTFTQQFSSVQNNECGNGDEGPFNVPPCAGPQMWGTSPGSGQLYNQGYDVYPLLPSATAVDLGFQDAPSAWSFYSTNVYTPINTSASPSPFAGCDPPATCDEYGLVGSIFNYTTRPSSDPVMLPAIPTSSGM